MGLQNSNLHCAYVYLVLISSGVEKQQFSSQTRIHSQHMGMKCEYILLINKYM